LEEYYSMTPRLTERLQRRLGRPSRPAARPTALKLAVLGGVLGLLGLLASSAGRSPTLAHLQVGVLSASERGNYYALVNALSAEAQQQKGHITNVASAGSGENIARLVASRTTSQVAAGLAG
jgi:ABC-type phosphate transport system substrate-binding protein